MKVAVKNISNNITQDEMDAGRLQSVFDITVEDGSKVTLPESFNQSVREDLVRDAEALVQDLTNTYSSKIDIIYSAKESDIMTV